MVEVEYTAVCRDPDTNVSAYFTIQARHEAHADVQARDAFFGLLAPPPQEKYDALEVEIYGPER